MVQKKSDRKTFFSHKKISGENTDATRFMGQKKHDRKILMLTVLMSGSLWLHFFVSDALPNWYVCMVRCDRPPVFVWLCKIHTIEDYVMCHATVVSIL